MKPQTRQTLLSPQGLSWKINGESALLLGGGRALLLQIAHPMVAAGVDRYSDFREDPLGRLRRTLDFMLTLLYGNDEERKAAAGEIHRRHLRVKGELEEGTEAFPKGSTYDARDPVLQLWVHATLVDTTVVTYETFFRELSAEEKEEFYQESKPVATILGVPEDIIPGTWEDFQEYMGETLAGPTLELTPTARRLAQIIMEPMLPFFPRPLFERSKILTLGLLPEEIRERYGYSWSPADEKRFQRTVRFVRRLLPYLPRWLRKMPHARKAQRRLPNEPGLEFRRESPPTP